MITITGSVSDACGNPIGIKIVFASLSTPLIYTGGKSITTTRTIIASDPATGDFSVQLAAGDYQVHYGATRGTQLCSFSIAVPDGNGVMTIDEVTTSALVYVFRMAPNILIPFQVLTARKQLAAGVQSDSVTGLNLGFAPAVVHLTVQCPANGLVLGANLVGAPTSDGFAFDLFPGKPDSGLYTLQALIVPPGSSPNSGIWPLPPNAQAGQVTGLNLAAAPTTVKLTVQIPVGGVALGACLTSAITTDGFSYALLPGKTDGVAGYKLHYTLSN